MLLSTILLSFLIYNISCDMPSYLFPSYDTIEENSTEIPCPELEKISNGNIIIQKLKATKKVAIITCDRGYDIEGNNKIHCINGQWEPYNSLPQCIKRCLPPPYVKNGALEIEGNQDEGFYPKGTVASYSCSQGYQLVPETSNLRVCERGVWTGPIASCVLDVIEGIGCVTPESIENGYFVQEKVGELKAYYVFGERLYYNCKSGYYMTGPRMQECLEGGNWSPDLQPICTQREDSRGVLDTSRSSAIGTQVATAFVVPCSMPSLLIAGLIFRIIDPV